MGSMSERFDKLFERMNLEFKKQNMELTYSLNRILSIKLEEKIKPLKQENQALKSEIEFLEKKIAYLERDNKRNNIIIFGFEEKETCVRELLEAIRKKMVYDLKISIMNSDINNVYRVGKRKDDATKPRPVIVTFLQTWKRNEVLRNKKKFRNIFVSEDFPKDVLEKRKIWLEELKEERKKGKIAYLVYDKLLVKPGKQDNNNKEEFDKEEDLSQLLDSLEQEENEEKQPRRRAKAMINRDKYKMLSDEEKPSSEAKTRTNKEKNVSDDEKPRRRAKAMINKNNSMFDKESEDEKSAEKPRRKAKAKITHNISFLDEKSEEDDKAAPRGKTTNKFNSLRKPLDEEQQDENSKTKAKASTSKAENFEEYVPHKRKIDY